MSDEPITLCGLEWTTTWNLRGNASRSAFASAASRVLGVALPLEPNTTSRCDGVTVFWTGPQSWLVVCDRNAYVFDQSRTTINTAGGALFDVSASYVGWKVSGDNAARVLNRSCPLDFDSRAFAAGTCAQSVLGHVNALFYRPSDANEFIVVVARSFGADAWHALCESAKTDGYRITEAERFDGP